MTATIKLYGPLKTYVDDRSEVSVAARQSVRAALTGLGIPVELVAMVVVNEEVQSKDYILRDGDIARMTMVLGGG